MSEAQILISEYSILLYDAVQLELLQFKRLPWIFIEYGFFHSFLFIIDLCMSISTYGEWSRVNL